jgi:ribosomal protein S18 acetylase RimI-like enzyme
MLEVLVDPPAAVIRSLLKHDPIRAAYLLGDLDPAIFPRCHWFVAAHGGQPVSAVLIFAGLSTPAVLSFGAPDGVQEILATQAGALPSACWVKIPPPHEAAYRGAYEILRVEPTWIMGLQHDDFRPASGSVTVRRLGRDEPLGPVLRVYDDYPGHFFEPSQLETGLYVGAFEGERLVSIAGTHARSPEDGTAVLGNIVTAHDVRGRGYAAACTSRLIEAHRDTGCPTIALHVAGTNTAAIRCYRNLGFAFVDTVLQARCEKRT